MAYTPLKRRTKIWQNHGHSPWAISSPRTPGFGRGSLPPALPEDDSREHWCYHTINATECTSRFCICFRALPKSFHNWLKSIYMLGLCSGAQAIASATGRKGCIRNYHRQMRVPVEASVMVDRCLEWRFLSGFHGHFSQPAPVQSALCSSRS